jgi:hypothetical protein
VPQLLLAVAILEKRRDKKQQGKPREQRRQIPRTHHETAFFRTRIRVHEPPGLWCRVNGKGCKRLSAIDKEEDFQESSNSANEA